MSNKIETILFCMICLLIGWIVGKSYKPQIAPEVELIIKNNASLFSLDPCFVKAIILTESSGKSYVKSYKGARGLMQIMPATAKQMAKELAIELKEDSIYEPEINIQIGCYYLHWLIRKFQGNLKLALAAYNTGPNRVMKWLVAFPNLSLEDIIEKNAIQETRMFVSHVWQRYEILKKSQ